MTPVDLLGVTRRRIVIVIVCAVVVPASALGWSLHQDNQYTATAQLLFRDPGFDQKLFGSSVLQPSADAERQAATNVLLVSNRRVAERAARSQALELSGDQIANKLDVAVEGEADVISVSMTDSDPIRSARLANTYSREFIEFRREADRAKITEAQRLVDRQRDQLSSSGTRSADTELRRQADQLKVLASLQTGNAELVQAAEPPGSPSSPRTVRNVVAAGFVGLLMGFGLAFLLERLDRRLRDPEEIETTFGRPILGTVPESPALGRTKPSLIDGPAWVERESFSMIRAKLRYFNVSHQTRSILVTSAGPGDGKTTITWNLAAAAAAAGDRVLIIEADLRHPSLLDVPGQKPKPGLGAFLAGSTNLSEVLRQLPVPTVRDGGELVRHMDVIPVGAIPPNPIDLLESEAMERLIRDAEERYDLVVIDTPPTAVVSDAIPLIKKVSGVIVVTRLGRSTRTSIQQLRQQLDNLDAPTLGVVVNGVAAANYGYGYGYGYGPASATAANGAPTTSPDDHESEPVEAGKTL